VFYHNYFLKNLSTSYETFISFSLIGFNSCNQENERHRERATYVCPSAKAPHPKSITQWSKLFPCTLWIVIAKASLKGNCVNVPITIGFQNSSSPSVCSQVFFVTSIFPPSSKTTITFCTKSPDICIFEIVPSVPFTY